jgi:hypothetical protein
MRLAKLARKVRRRLTRFTVTERVVSFGGVGSSALVAHLERGDEDRIWYHSRDKHCLDPELLPEAGRGLDVRACFVFGDPRAAVLSVFRRGLHRRHERSMSRAIPGYRPVLEAATTLEDYLEAGVDRFHLEAHLDRWIHYPGGRVEVLAVKYEALDENIDQVLSFLRCSRPFHVRPRTRSVADEPEHVRRGLERMYGKLAARINALPALFRPPLSR